MIRTKATALTASRRILFVGSLFALTATTQPDGTTFRKLGGQIERNRVALGEFREYRSPFRNRLPFEGSPMTRVALLPCLLAGLSAAGSMTAIGQTTTATEYASDASRIVSTYELTSREHTPDAMARAAQAFLDSLDPEQRKQAALELKDRERRLWTNLPARPGAGGIALGDCTQTQVEAFCDLMGTLLSEEGYAKMVNIMLADDQLIRGGRTRSGIGTASFAVVLFGKPSPNGPWGFQLDGHHVGLNLAISGDQLTMSPSFIGTQPEAYHLAGQSIRPLSGEIDGAYKLINSLSPELRSQAILSSTRGRLRSGPGTDGQVPTAAGAPCSEFTEAQKETLLGLIAEWVNNLPPKQAEQRLEELRGELDQMRFAWNGPIEQMSDISYAIQGPSLIIEYACQDLGGNPLDHLHTMYRDPTNEYGGQLD